ncbi:hypothetical protein CRU99_09790 [Malaciobacter mytili]|uniref:transporter substrate-binding domain-containing protein n=1 Tax=Malaciobacter mytili TaxID=603050 RepID=UPI00100C1F97|nr:transporter substrate-binding domain-containing protein [Malaciobacter mytili]RXI41308.1 hypothetical protein CRU99_09790 [Malaciobacter mytili]
MIKIFFSFFIIFLYITNAKVELTLEEKAFIKANPKIVLGLDKNWNPYIIKKGDLLEGLEVDYINLINKKLGTNITLVADEWKNIIFLAKSKQIDGLALSSISNDRKTYFDFSKTYLQSYKYIFTLSNKKVTSFKDLENKKVAIQYMNNFEKYLLEDIKNIKTVYVKNKDEAHKLLLEGSIDAFIGDNVDRYLLKLKGIENIQIAFDIKESIFNAVYSIRKDWPILVSILNKAIDDITLMEKRELYKKWFNFEKLNLNRIIFSQEELEFIKNKKVVIASATPWEPFHVEKQEGVQTGISYDFWDLIKEKSGLKSINIEVDTFTSVLNCIKDKTCDMAVAVGETKDRKQYALFSKSYATFPISIATSKDINHISSIDSLKDRKIAVGENYTAHKKMLEKYPSLNYIVVKNIQEGLELLSKGKVFAYVDIMPVLAHNINKYGYTNLKISGNTGINFDVTFMIRDDYALLVSIINKVTNTILEEEKQKILNKWIAVVYHESINYILIFYILGVVFIVVSIIFYKNRQLLKYQNVIKQKNRILEKQKKELENTNNLLKNTQDNLQKSLDSFKVLVNSTIEAVLIEKQGKIEYANDSFVKVFEYDNQEEVYKNTIDDFFVNSILKKDCSNISFEFLGVTKNGVEFPILVKKESLIFEKEKATIISIFDLSELKDKEQLILQQSKMVSMGEMIGNIAHQWRQPLTAITTAATSLKIRKQLGDFNDEILEEVIEAIMRNSKFLSQTIDDFKNYLKDSKEKQKFNIKDIFEQSLNLIRPALKNSFINDNINMDGDIYIESYFNELNQALINILNNAKDALIEKEQLEDKAVFLKAYMQEDEVILEIKDNAGGIPLDIIDSIFEPYFTTKHQSQGTGLGLYMTYKIITESLNGSIKVTNTTFIYKNKKCSGAKFIIRLPYS